MAAVNVTTGLILLAVCVKATGGEVKLNDFYREAWLPYVALAHGHVLGFFRAAPAYVGSLVLRAPFALFPRLWGSGGPRAAYFASAIPCAIALAVFTTWCTVRLQSRFGSSRASRLGPYIACALNPVLIVALLGGHPEEILGAVLCIAAVVLAAADRKGWCAIVLGLAIVNKSWAVVAIPVVLVTLTGLRARTVVLAVALGAGALTLGMDALKGGVGSGPVGAQIGTIFTVPQLFWWFGAHSWVAQHARYLMVGVTALCALVLGARRRPRLGTAEALALLALVMLLRAALDPWNNLYYHVPFLLALAAYEANARKIPILTIVYSYVLLIIVPVGGVLELSNNLHAALYAALVVPTAGWLGWKAYESASSNRAAAAARRISEGNPASVTEGRKRLPQTIDRVRSAQL